MQDCLPSPHLLQCIIKNKYNLTYIVALDYHAFYSPMYLLTHNKMQAYLLKPHHMPLEIIFLCFFLNKKHGLSQSILPHYFLSFNRIVWCFICLCKLLETILQKQPLKQTFLKRVAFPQLNLSSAFCYSDL